MPSDPVARGGAGALRAYALLVGVAGVGVLVWAVVLGTPVGPVLHHPLTLGSLALALVLSELTSVPATRRDATTSPITISTTFAVALIAIGPVSFVLLVHVLAVLVDDVRCRRRPIQVLFNAGQYAVSTMAARAVFCALTGVPVLGVHTAFDADLLLPALAAGVVFVVVNDVLVSVVAALATQQHPLPVLREDLRFKLETSGVLVALGPIAALVAQVSVLLLPLLVLPVLAVRRTALLAATREHQSLHDPLTGLANRALFRSLVERAIARQHERGVALLLLDLDHFKDVNDTLGHHVGDELLCEVAARLVRAAGADAASTTVARLGGDEFAVLLTAHDPLARASELAERLLRDLSEPVEVARTRLTVQASIGITTSAAAPLDDVHGALKQADIAMYEAKEERARACVHVPGTDTGATNRLMLLPRLREAIDAGELVVEYQPQVDALTGSLVAVEALVRWDHPTMGRLEPAAFVGLAEGAGLVAPITTHVLETALGALARWRAAGWRGSVAVNLSARQLSDVDLPSHVATLLEAAGVPPACLTVEVTESSLMADPRAARRVLTALRTTGVRLAVDDVGTGWSSLVLLQQLAVDELKVDRSFVVPLVPGGNDEVLVRSIIELGHNLGLRVVAEGVERSAVAGHLARLGCDVLQGHHVGHPMPLESATEVVLAAVEAERGPVGRPVAGRPVAGRLAVDRGAVR